MQFGFLSALVWLPIATGVLILVLGDQRIVAGKWVALIGSLLTLVISLPLMQRFDGSTAAFQFVEKLPWIPSFKAYYHLGVDGIALPLVLLTAFITVPVVFRKAGWTTMPAGLSMARSQSSS